MKTTIKLTLALVFLLFAGCRQLSRNSSEAGNDDFAGTISISGAFALYPLANIWAEEFKKVHPDVKFNISAGGAGKGMVDALSGAVDLGMFSRELTKEEVDKGAWHIAVAKDAVLPTINAENPLLATIKKRGLTKEEFRKIFVTGELKSWADITSNLAAGNLNTYTRSDAAGAAATWAQYLGASGQEELKGVGVFGDPGLADAVKKDAFGIGFNNVIYIYDMNSGKKYPGLEVIPLDINEDGKIDDQENFYDNIDQIKAAIGDGRYPSPPARELYFIANGKPNSRLVKQFLIWVLKDGQKYIDEAGYIALPEVKLTEEYEELNVENVL